MLDEDFEQQLTAKPDNFILRTIYADWLEEHGEMDYSFAQRWMAAVEKHPMKILMCKPWDDFPDNDGYLWLFGRADLVQSIYEPCKLPATLKLRCSLWNHSLHLSEYPSLPSATEERLYPWRYYLTRTAAEQELARALKSVGEVSNLELPASQVPRGIIQRNKRGRWTY